MAIRTQLIEAFNRRKYEADFWLSVLLFGALGAAFWPITTWIAGNAADQSRLLHSLAVLLMATIALIKFGNIPIENVLSLNPAAGRALALSFGLLILQFIVKNVLPETTHGFISFLTIPAYSSALVALVRYVFGEGTTRISRTTGGALCGFLLLSALMAPLDWPLRGLAGQFSATVLSWIGQSVELGLLQLQSGPPKLILLVNQHPFDVAAECNGFGIIMTSLLIGLLLAIYRRVGPLGIVFNLAVGLVIGLALNTLRIVLIVLLAPALMDYYMLMHEIVGGLSYWGGLLLVWIVLKGPTRPEALPSQA